VFSATTDYNTSAYQSATSHLYSLPVTGGEAHLISDETTDYGQVQFSEDGKYVLATGHTNGTKIYYLEQMLLE
jgi:hypothetical protein